MSKAYSQRLWDVQWKKRMSRFRMLPQVDMSEAKQSQTRIRSWCIHTISRREHFSCSVHRKYLSDVEFWISQTIGIVRITSSKICGFVCMKCAGLCINLRLCNSPDQTIGGAVLLLFFYTTVRWCLDSTSDDNTSSDNTSSTIHLMTLHLTTLLLDE